MMLLIPEEEQDVNYLLLSLIIIKTISLVIDLTISHIHIIYLTDITTMQQPWRWTLELKEGRPHLFKKYIVNHL